MVHAALMQALTVALVGWNNKVLKGNSQAFTEYPGGKSAKDAAFDTTGKLYIIDLNSEVFMLDKEAWVKLPGATGSSIAGGCDGPMIIGSSQVFKWSGFSWALYPGDRFYAWSGTEWKIEGGYLTGREVGSDGRNPWLISAGTSRVFYYDVNAWREYPGNIKANKISVARDGTPYAIDMDAKIMKGTGSGWVEMPGTKRALDVVVSGTGVVWMVEKESGEPWYFVQGRWYRHPAGKEGIAIAAP